MDDDLYIWYSIILASRWYNIL